MLNVVKYIAARHRYDSYQPFEGVLTGSHSCSDENSRVQQSLSLGTGPCSLDQAVGGNEETPTSALLLTNTITADSSLAQTVLAPCANVALADVANCTLGVADVLADGGSEEMAPSPKEASWWIRTTQSINKEGHEPSRSEPADATPSLQQTERMRIEKDATHSLNTSELAGSSLGVVDEMPSEMWVEVEAASSLNQSEHEGSRQPGQQESKHKIAALSYDAGRDLAASFVKGLGLGPLLAD